MISNNDDKDKNKRRKEFERMIHDIEQMMRESLRDVAKNRMEPGKSYVHGFNINIGPDGKAKVDEFGNYPRRTRQKTTRQKISEEREPTVDVIENKKDVSITIEIPGVKKEDIDLNVVDNILEIKTNIPKYRYHKKIPLPCKVKPKTTKATYKNGILDIVIEKKETNKKDHGYHARIE